MKKIWQGHDTIPPELHNKYLGIVLDETERLTKLTNSLLTLNNLNTKEIIAAHNENINAISTPREGTEFIFTIARSEMNDKEE